MSKKHITHFWPSMTDAERYAYLLRNDLNIESRMGISASSKVGDKDAVRTSYAAFRGGVQVSDWHPTESAAMHQQTEVMANWKLVAGDPQ